MKLVILDRDGVINHESDAYIRTPQEWLPIAGSLEAIAKLTAAGYTITIATNQSGVARGFFDLAMLHQIHETLLAAVREHGGNIYKIYYCPHGPNDGCNCRKPKPGMFEQMQRDLNVDFKSIKPIFIGDSLRDVELGLATDCKVFLTTGIGSHGGETILNLSAAQKQQIDIVENLAAATASILS